MFGFKNDVREREITDLRCWIRDLNNEIESKFLLGVKGRELYKNIRQQCMLIKVLSNMIIRGR